MRTQSEPRTQNTPPSATGTSKARNTPTYDVPRGTAVLTTQQALIYPVSFLFYLLVARILSSSEIGQVSLLSAALAIFTTVTQVALPFVATQFISTSLAHQDHSTAGRVAKTATLLLLVFSIPTLAISIIVSIWVGPKAIGANDAASLLTVTFLAGFLLDLVALYGGVFLGLGLYTKRAYQYIVYVPLSRGLGIVLAYLGFGVFGVVLGWAIGALATLGMSLLFSRGLLPPSHSYPSRPLLSFGLPLFASALVAFGQGWGDIALLQALLGRLGTTGSYFLVVSSVGGVGLSTIGPLSILWTPVSAALYPALTSSHSKRGIEAVSSRLAVAFRLTNLVVLPAGAALAAVAPTALELAYGPEYAVEALPFAILTLTAIAASQATLLSTALQSVAKTRQLFSVTLSATCVDLLVVALTARTLGTVGGALGRALLAVTIMLLARRILGPPVSMSVSRGLFKALLLAAGASLPIAITDQVLTHVMNWGATIRLPMLLVVFSVSFLVASRRLKAFQSDDFALAARAIPPLFHRPLKLIQHLLTMNGRGGSS